MPARKVNNSLFPRKINFSLQEGVCNQRCPKCFVHGTNNYGEKKLSGAMPQEQIVRLLNEASRHSCFVGPGFFSESMVAKNFAFFIREAKKNRLPVNICTNGVLLDEAMGAFLLDMDVALLSVSLDALTRETFHKVRGVDKFDQVVANILRFLKLRGDAKRPRVTVSFGIEETNRYEKQSFLDFWIAHADCVKIYGVYDHAKRLYDVNVSSRRLPCREVFDQMNVYFDGTAIMCCLDGRAKTNLGNVFEKGIGPIWNSEAYNTLRRRHTDNDYSDLAFCRDCSLWANYDITREESVGGVQIRSSEGIEYHTRLDRLEGWTDELKRVEISDLFGA